MTDVQRWRRVLRRRVVPGAILLVALAASTWALARHATQLDPRVAGRDFLDYYYAAKALSSEGASIYDHSALVRFVHAELGVRGVPPLVYPPLIVVLFLPLAQLPYETARLTWLVVNQALLALTVWGAARIWHERTSLPPRLFFSVVFALFAVASAPHMHHDWQGQANLLVLALTTWSLRFHLAGSKRADALCGALLAPAVLLKVFPAILVPYLLARRAWRAVLWTAAVALVITALSLLVVPWSDYLRYPHVLARSMYVLDSGPIPGNLSLAETGRLLAARAGLLGPCARWLVGGLRLLPLPVLLWLAAREARGEEGLRGEARLVAALRLTQAFLLVGCVMDKMWLHHLVLLLPCVYLSLRLVVEERRLGVPALMLGVSVLLMATVYHPLLLPEALRTTAMAATRAAILHLDRLALVLLFVGLELLMVRLKRANVAAVAGS